MRAVATLLLLATACAPASRSSSPAAPAAAQAPHNARYILASIDGHEMPAASPTEANLTIDEMRLSLMDGGGYTLSLTGRRGMEKTPGTIGVRGTYAVSGDTLVLSAGMPRDLPDPSAPEGPNPARFTWCGEGDTLHLRDGRAHLFTFRSGSLDVRSGRSCSGFAAAR